MADAEQDAFAKVKRGKLRLKGGTSLSSKKSKKKSSKGTKRARQDAAQAGAQAAADGTVAPAKEVEHSVAMQHAEDEADAASKRLRAEEDAFGTYASQGGHVATYRVKSRTSIGSYKIVKEVSSRPLTRTELLEKRSKHKSDRMCM